MQVIDMRMLEMAYMHVSHASNSVLLQYSFALFLYPWTINLGDLLIYINQPYATLESY